MATHPEFHPVSFKVRITLNCVFVKGFIWTLRSNDATPTRTSKKAIGLTE